MSKAVTATDIDGIDSSGDFPFVGEALALDLVNTQIVARGKPQDLLTTPDALTAWWRAASSRFPDAGLAPVAAGSAFEEQALLATTRELRAGLRSIFSAVVDQRRVADSDLTVLNRILHDGYELLVVGLDGGLHPCLGSHDAGPDAVLLPIARSAFDLLTGKDPARLHRCANDRCVLMFYDTTKSATRRWCSVACMNRARSRRRHQERKDADSVSRGAASMSGRE